MATKKANFRVEVTGKTAATLNIKLNSIASFDVKLYKPFEDNKGFESKMGCPTCFNPISRPSSCTNEKCKSHGVLAEHNAPVKIVIEGDQILVINETDLNDLDLPTMGAFITDSVPLFKNVEALSVYSQNLYYVVPATSGSALIYAGVVAQLNKSGRVIMGKFTLRSNKELLGMIRVLGDQLVLQCLPLQAERRPLPKFEQPEITKSDITNFGKLFGLIKQEFVYSDLQDEYGEAVKKLIQDLIRIKMGKTPTGKVTKGTAKVVNETESAREAIERMFESVNAMSAK